MICIQASTQHDHVAVITALYLATFNIGSACGSTLSDATLTQTLVPRLMDSLPEPFHNNRNFAENIRSSPSYYTEL
jgi:SIT family siderophore-iron:H+ symporter-like MFS transporter